MCFAKNEDHEHAPYWNVSYMVPAHKLESRERRTLSPRVKAVRRHAAFVQAWTQEAALTLARSRNVLPAWAKGIKCEQESFEDAPAQRWE